MLNSKGEIFFKEFGETIKPSLKFDEFKRMKLFLASENTTINMPYLMYDLPAIIDGEKVISFTLDFNEKGNLQLIHIWDGNDRFGTSWDDYTKEKENLRNTSTKEWIEKYDVAIDKHKWGEIKLAYDFKNGTHDWLISINNC